MAKNILKFLAGTSGAGGVGSALGVPGQSVTQGNYALLVSNSKNLSTSGIFGIFDLALGQMQTPHAELNSNNAQAASIRQGISSALKNSRNPYVMAAGYASDLMDKTGGFTDASKGLGKGTDNLNMAASLTLPGFGYFTSSVGSYKMSDTMKSMSNSYSGSYQDNLEAQSLSGGKYLFGRDKAKNKLELAKRIDGTISNIKYNAEQDQLAQQNMSPMIGQQNMFALQGGYLQGLARAAKYGAKLEKAQNTFRLLNTKINPSTNKTKEEDELFFLSFKQGGTIEKEEFIIESFSTKSEQEDLDFFNSLTSVLEFKQGGDIEKYAEGGLTDPGTTPTPQYDFTKLYDAINAVSGGDIDPRKRKFESQDKFIQVYNNVIKPVYNYLRGKGWTSEQVAGAMGNMMQESAFNQSLRGGISLLRGTHLKNYNNTYTTPTWLNHLDYVDDWKNSKLYKDRTVNYNYRSKDYNNSDHSNAKSSAEAFYKYWEAPGKDDTTLSKRLAWADILYRWFNNPVGFHKLGGELNVIPEGALHAHKHHMEGADNFTKKGIPVVSEEEGGQLEQQAEIERNEIIFRLEVTQKLEEWYKKFKESESQKEKDELAIEAGKLLTHEILENTEDRTGLIELVV